MEVSSLGDENKKTFVEKIITEIYSRNISFQFLANGVGENVNTIKQVLYGRRKIKLDLAKKICAYLNLDFYEMTKDDTVLNSIKYTTFGQKFAHFLDVHNLSQIDVANQVGVSRSTISNIVNDRLDTRKDTIIKICGKFNLDFYDMVKDDTKYSEFFNNANNKTSIMTLFQKVGIFEPTPEYEDILTNLIYENRNLFLPKHK